MKLSIIALLLLFGQTLVLQASEVDIDAQIAKIEQASEEERFRLVNALKRQIAQMNANQQARAIAQYQQETLQIQQQTDLANEMVINNQMQKEQERQTIVPPITTPIPIDKSTPITIPQEPNQEIIIKPQPYEDIQTEQPTYQKEPLPIEKPEYIPTPNPVEKPIVETPVEIPTQKIEKPTYKPVVPKVQKPEKVFVEAPKELEPVYVPPAKQTPAPKVKPVQKPTYTKPKIPNKPSSSKGRF